MKTFKQHIQERLLISKNKQNYSIDDITAKELCELVEKYREYHGVLPSSTNSSKMDLHDIYGDNDKNLPYNKEPGSQDMQIVYLSGITHRRKSGDDKYGLYLTGTKNQAMFRYGMAELLDILGEDCLIEIYSFLKKAENKYEEFN
jgi:hypothetical protein